MSHCSRNRAAVFLGYLGWCAFVLWMVGDALRHNDEAAYINGAVQIAQGSISPWNADLFNYDKQYASYWFISEIVRSSDFRSLILATNYAQAIGFCLSFGVFIFYKLENTNFVLVLLLILCPILVLSVPFVETGILSLIFLMLAFSITRRGSAVRRGLACALIAIAAACRADVVLAVPALLLTEISRRTFRGLLVSPFAWTISLCSVLPPLIGKLLAWNASGILQGGPSPFKVVAGFIVFALGLGLFTLLLWSSLYFAVIAARKSTWRLYYTLRAISPMIPFIILSFSTTDAATVLSDDSLLYVYDFRTS